MAVLTARTCILCGILKPVVDLTPATGSVGCRWPSVPLVLMLRCFYVAVTSVQAFSNLHFGAAPCPTVTGTVEMSRQTRFDACVSLSLK